MSIDRERTLRVIREVADVISDRTERDPSFSKSLRGDGERIRRGLVEDACRRVGLSPEDYDATLASDPELVQIEGTMLREGALGQQDPGPYDALSPRDPIGSSDVAPGTPSHGPAPIDVGVVPDESGSMGDAPRRRSA